MVLLQVENAIVRISLLLRTVHVPLTSILLSELSLKAKVISLSQQSLCDLHYLWIRVYYIIHCIQEWNR